METQDGEQESFEGARAAIDQARTEMSRAIGHVPEIAGEARDRAGQVADRLPGAFDRVRSGAESTVTSLQTMPDFGAASAGGRLARSGCRAPSCGRAAPGHAGRLRSRVDPRLRHRVPPAPISPGFAPDSAVAARRHDFTGFSSSRNAPRQVHHPLHALTQERKLWPLGRATARRYLETYGGDEPGTTRTDRQRHHRQLPIDSCMRKSPWASSPFHSGAWSPWHCWPPCRSSPHCL